LRVADKILTDVKLRLKADGSWVLLSSGPVRAATSSDTPGATLAAPGNNTDLDSAQTDATLTVTRLHVGTSVFGGVEIRLTGKTWAFVKALQQVKTLHAEDFNSNTAIRADESHHVILKSSPDTGVQNVPMQLSYRNYEFCMDAQAEGADTMVLLDASGSTVFTLKAGEACVTIKPKAGAYTMRHRYGGTGSARTVFMRNRINTTLASTAARRMSAPVFRLLGAAATPDTLLVTKALNFSGPEYWSVNPDNRADQASDSPNFLGVVGRSSSKFPEIGPAFCADPPNFGFQNLWLSNTFLAVTRDGLGAPQKLGVPLACTSDRAAQAIGLVTSYIADVDDIGSWNIQTAFQSPNAPSDWGSSPDGRQFGSYLYKPAVWAPQTFLISNLNQTQFELVLPNGDRVTAVPPGPDSFGANYQLATFPAYSDPMSFPSVALKIKFRYFPEGLPTSVSLGVGEVALFTGAGCTGGAVISEHHDIPYFTGGDIAMTNVYGAPLYEPTYLPGLNTLGKSFQLGLHTSITAYTGQYYQGEAQQFDQLTCITSDVGSSSQPMASLSIAIDTVRMVITTDSCEYCNLAGMDFSGQNLASAKLSYANLNGAILSGADLSGADLRNASLQGAYLISTNLDSANLCSAQLNGSQGVTQAATLTGAHLRNTNLASANLDGVKLSSVSFYSSNWQASCQQTSCGSYVAPTCASAYNASINNTSFDSAYLSNVDMSNVKGAGVNFNNAALFGVLFGQANLSHNSKSSVSSSFINTYLQGSDLSRATLQFADFTGAQFDADSACIQANLKPTYKNFPGAKVPDSPGSSTCVLGKPVAAFCVESSFTASPGYPKTDCTNICADGSAAGGVVPTNGSCQNTASCSPTSWAAPLNGGGNNAIPISSCRGTAPLCGSNPFVGDITDRCW
jgi:uncharacterized protein YjbI with pentapeptide repeats